MNDNPYDVGWADNQVRDAFPHLEPAWPGRVRRICGKHVDRQMSLRVTADEFASAIFGAFCEQHDYLVTNPGAYYAVASATARKLLEDQWAQDRTEVLMDPDTLVEVGDARAIEPESRRVTPDYAVTSADLIDLLNRYGVPASRVGFVKSRRSVSVLADDLYEAFWNPGIKDANRQLLIRKYGDRDRNFTSAERQTMKRTRDWIVRELNRGDRIASDGPGSRLVGRVGALAA